MSKRTKEAWNMFFSVFLIIGYVTCCYFILQLAFTITNQTLYDGVTIVLVAVFGLLLFYATRVGDGKQILRFSPSVLILMILPSLYVISAFFAVGLPLHNEIQDNNIILHIAAVALGYGIPYSFTSGFELVAAEDVFYPERADGREVTPKEEPKENKANKKRSQNKKKK